MPLITFIRAQLLTGLVALGCVLQTSHALAQTPAPPPPNCTHCKEKLQTLSALRKALPADWRVQLEREPVFDSEILTVQAGQSNAQTLLLVHGLGNNGFTDWLTVMPQLARQYHVIALDLPGFGYSAAPGGKYSPANYARVLSWLLTRFSHGKAIVVGHSLGGAVVLRFASEYPGQLDKLVLVDAAGILQRTAFIKHGARVPRQYGDIPGIKDAVARLNGFLGDTVDKVLALPDVTRILGASDLIWDSLLGNRAQVNAAMALVEEDYSRAVPAMTTPTWLIWGADDPIAPLRTGQTLASRLPSAQLVVMPGTGHTPMDAPTAAAFLPLLERALTQAPQPALLDTRTDDAVDIQCKGEADRFITGRFREVLIDGCTNARLEQFSADRVVVRNSSVRMLNARIGGEDLSGPALDVTNSELIGTAGSLSGETALRADAARVDLAGFVLTGRQRTIDVLHLSRLTASLCELRTSAGSRAWQESGDFENRSLTP
ncbi:MAG TPA: alpha/beta hydrolase [Rhodocyclaceae bacterium]|nr:alpha/beta hydrolase [Rhodocyclaceae bacterium]